MFFLIIAYNLSNKKIIEWLGFLMEVMQEGEIFSPKQGQLCDYQIIGNADDVFAVMIDDKWQTNLYNQVMDAKQASGSKQELIQKVIDNDLGDFHWCWSSIVAPVDQDDYQKVTFYLTVSSEPEGVIHAYFPKESRLKTGASIVYIDRIAVAPWNRANQPEKHYKGIGSLLMVFICNFSKNSGFDGVIGLHSLPQAEAFYKYLGMDDCGKDVDYEDLKYFELSEISIPALLN